MNDTTSVNMSVYGQIVEKMINFDANGSTIVPWLAESYQWVNNKTLELKLRQGVSFTNGEPFDAASAKFSIDAIVKSDAYAFMVVPGVYQGTEVIDDHTMQVHLNAPYASFISFLGYGSYALPPKYYQQVQDSGFSNKPVGTGPFQLKEWAKGDHVTLSRNDKYWNGPHPLATVEFKIIPNDTSRIAALQTGEVDIATILPVDALAEIQKNDQLNTFVTPGLRKFATHFDTMTGPTPLSDKRVRTALNLAVDKEAIVKKLYEGAGDPLQGQWEANFEYGFDSSLKMFPYDVTQAKKLLSEAEHPNGFDLQLSYTVGRYPLDKQLGEIVASYLQQAGIKVKQRGLEYGTFSNLFNSRTIGTHQWGLLLPPDPYLNYSTFMEGTKAEPNPYEWTDIGPQYTKLVTQAFGIIDHDQALALYKQAGQIMHDDPPMIFLLVPRDIDGVNKRVSGFKPRVDQVISLYTVDVTK